MTPTELIRGTIGPIILSLLEAGPRYGYDMIKQVDARSGGLLEWREGTLYPALHRLEAEGLIRSKWKDTDNGKQRKYYHLTAKGKRELAANRDEWKSFAKAVNALLRAAT